MSLPLTTSGMLSSHGPRPRSRVRYLVDECLGRRIVTELRDRGNDVVWVRESASGMSDEDVLAWSVRDRRVLLTEDFDYGELIFGQGRSAYGVVILRLSAFRGSWAEVATAVTQRLEKVQGRLTGNLTVLDPTRIKPRALPAS
jgi:predicted nuclease of predicted toxin-antitoxin system